MTFWALQRVMLFHGGLTIYMSCCHMQAVYFLTEHYHASVQYGGGLCIP